MQQQLLLQRAAKKDTEELYGAFLNAAREAAAAESKYGKPAVSQLHDLRPHPTLTTMLVLVTVVMLTRGTQGSGAQLHTANALPKLLS